MTSRTYIRLQVGVNEVERIDDNTIELALPIDVIPGTIPDELESLGLSEGQTIEIMKMIDHELVLNCLRSRLIREV